MKNPWFKFYPTDWKGDDALRLCSPAARGLWIEILCICHQATPYGHLLIDANAPTDDELSVLTGIRFDEIPKLLGELEKKKIFSRTGKGVIYSRRMVRDAKRLSQNAKNGKNGGNPNLCKETEKSLSVNPLVKGGVKAQISESDPEIKDLYQDTSSAREESYPQAVGRRAFDIERFLTDADRAMARERAAGWDLYGLIRQFNGFVARSEVPRDPVAAFFGWLSKFTKGKKP